MASKNNYFVQRYGKLIHIYDPIFRANFWYQTVKDFSKATALLKKQGFNYEFKINNNGGFTVYETQGCEVCVMWTKGKDSDIVHECSHATHFVLSKAGIKLNEETDEIYSYYVAFLFKTIKGVKTNGTGK